MHKSELTERVEVASILGNLPSDDDELATRARSILRWKIRYNSIRVVAQNGHVILSGNVFSCFDREAAEQTVRKLTGVVTLTNRIITTSPYITTLHRASEDSRFCASLAEPDRAPRTNRRFRPARRGGAFGDA